MKASRIVLAVLMAGVITLTGCISKAGSAATPKTQLFTVERGDLNVEINAAGNLALSLKEDLAFEISGTQTEPLTVDEVKVEAGDSVEKGQVLVTLDTTALDKKITTRQRAYDQAAIQMANANNSVTTAQIDLQTAKSNDQSITTTETSLETATINFNRLNYPFNRSTFVFDIPAALDDMRSAQSQLEAAKAGIEAGPGSDKYFTAMDQYRQAQYRVNEAMERLARGMGLEAFDSTSISRTVSDYLAARSAKITMDQAQVTLDKTRQSYQTAIDKAQLSLDRAMVSLDQAKTSLTVAKEDLDEAKGEMQKATIVAPFSGFVSKVNVKGGDEVRKGTVAVQVADPNKFQADIMVSEMDIFQVKLGGKASVQVSAMPSLVASANVTAVSPTATIQSGVVNYKVTVELEPLDVARQRPQTAPAAAQRPAGMTRPGTTQQRQPRAAQAPAPTVVPEKLQLRDGLTVTVSIIVDQRSSVLLVPNTAISRQGTQSTVKVSQGAAVEERPIKTGVSNWQYTEVTEGLNEGEKVVVPLALSTSGSSSQPKPPAGGIPGIRIMR